MMKVSKYPLYVKVCCVLISVVIVVYILDILQAFLLPMVFSILISILLLPLCNKLEKFKVPRSIAITLCLLLTVCCIALFFYIVIMQIRTFDEIIPALKQRSLTLYESINQFLRNRFNVQLDEETLNIKDNMSSIFENTSGVVSGTLSTTTGLLSNLALVPLYTFLLLYYRDFFREFLHRAINIKDGRTDDILGRIKKVILSYMTGLLLVIAIVGVLNTLSLWLLGIDHAIFFGFFAAVLVLLPYIGIAIGSFLPIMMALITKDSAWYAFGVAASFGAIQFLEGNFITPYVVGSQVSINPFAAIVALILFGNLWGIGGLILALPLTAIIKVIADSFESLEPLGFLLGDVD
ncbi:MAG: putative PurR-regulated permease PerM [Spirosomataceae bacterium]|jgi:predicted PurR-regulated permease PerM